MVGAIIAEIRVVGECVHAAEYEAKGGGFSTIPMLQEMGFCGHLPYWDGPLENSQDGQVTSHVCRREDFRGTPHGMGSPDALSV